MMERTLYWDHLTPETARIRKERLEGILESGERARFVDLSGERIFEVSGNPVREPDGIIRHVAYIVRDITDRVKADQDLIESEARQRRLFEESPLPMYIYDTDTLMIIDANAAMMESYGYTRDELTSMTIGDKRRLSHPEQASPPGTLQRRYGEAQDTQGSRGKRGAIPASF
jgi:PAS domain-containing protein